MFTTFCPRAAITDIQNRAVKSAKLVTPTLKQELLATRKDAGYREEPMLWEPIPSSP